MIALAFREMGEAVASGKIRTAMAVTTISIAMLIFSGFLLVSHNLHVGLDRFRTATRMEVLLKEQADAVAIAGRILKMEGVAGARSYSRQEALQYFREAQGDELARGITEALGENPFPAFIEVELAPSLESADALATELKKIEGVSEVLYGRETLDRLSRIAALVSNAALGIGGVMSFFILLIVINGVRSTVHARAPEIRVMRLVGATDGCIRLPFLLEGALTGLLGAGIGLAALYAAFLPLAARIPFIEIEFLTPESMIAAALFAAALGALGGVIAVREALEKDV